MSADPDRSPAPDPARGRRTRRTLRARGALAALALAALGASCASTEPGSSPARPEPTEPTIPATAAPPPTWPLSGLPVDDPTRAERRALVVKIDNVDQYARPQAGINQADIVYEEKIEGPISRFAAIFHSQDVAEVGPVRSGRSTDVAIVAPLAVPLYSFSGANEVFIELLRAAPLIDIGYDVQPASYDRKPGRVAPDNLFTSTERLWALAPPEPSPPPPQLVYRAEGASAPDSAVALTSFSYSFGGGPVGQPVTMTWDPAVGGWVREQKGTLHVDTDGVAIAPPNVIVQFVPYRDTGLVDTSDTPVPEALLVGSGTAWVFTAGTATAATWTKASDDAVTSYAATADGAPVELTPGQTWIALVPEGGELRGVRTDGAPLIEGERAGWSPRATGADRAEISFRRNQGR